MPLNLQTDVRDSISPKISREWIERARALKPLLEASAADIEQSRSIPAHVLDGLHAAQMFRTVMPRSVGGAELDPATHAQVVAAIAEAGARTHRWQVERLPATDPRWLQRASEADLLWIESPSNPLLEVADLAAICAAPRRSGTRIEVDNRFATPLLQRPLQLGADIVVHSATKLIGGHSDLLLGAAVTADGGELALLRDVRSRNGATPGMLECFLALRGARTLALRLRHAQSSAQQFASRLHGHAAVSRVRYPGFGTVVSFELKDAPAADRACRATRIIRHATSLGGIETSMERRSTHPGQEHIPPGLIRLSAGCEHIDDLWRDLDAALRAT